MHDDLEREAFAPATPAEREAESETEYAPARGGHPLQPLSRAELRNRALESRNSYQLGELPGEEVGAEIDQALQRESEAGTTLGTAFRFLVVEDIPDEERINSLKEYFDHTSPGTAIGLRQHLDAVRFGIFPQGSSMARQIVARIKSTMRNHDFSPSAREVLEKNINALEGIASDVDAFEAEQDKAELAEQSVDEKLSDRTGVYVFTYPHYLRHPTHPSKESEKMPDRTLMKVGFADHGILDRVNQETSGAGVPEHRRVLRAYLTTPGKSRSSRNVERQFHELLDSAGHAGPKRGSTEYQRGGREWFYSNVDFLDRIAQLLDLEIIEIDSPQYEL
ncbi:MAG: GIY-YIG nuclease family protein [Acidimicrobiaceae bacterium]|nr:GIY-YIG nuclease family protein [Acidimicrobiia bacterium]MCY4494064.1 GIY-YIG nuclease family protein [Acidimicrobiaceae bacterium]